jgi:hypothetical protein
LSYIENGGNVNRDQNRGKNATLLVALQLMRVLVAKLPVGGHLSSALLQKLFQVCEIDSVNNLIPPLVDNGMSSAQIQQTVTGNSENAILAVEILTEIMSKRYIPPSTHVSLLVELVSSLFMVLDPCLGYYAWITCLTVINVLSHRQGRLWDYFNDSGKIVQSEDSFVVFFVLVPHLFCDYAFVKFSLSNMFCSVFSPCVYYIDTGVKNPSNRSIPLFLN